MANAHNVYKAHSQRRDTTIYTLQRERGGANGYPQADSHNYLIYLIVDHVLPPPLLYRIVK